jgi:uncharacterized protein (TIGR00251 family)
MVAVARVTVLVSANAARSEVVGRHGDAWKVRVAAAPERGRANAALVELLASVLCVASRDVELRSGATSRRKTLEVRGLETRDVERRLAQAVKV